MIELYPVRLTEFPVSRYLQMQQHHDAMLREFALIAVGAQDPEMHEVPRRLLELVAELGSRFAAANELRDAVQAAYDRGERVITLELSIPPATLRYVEDLLVLFDEGDAYCREGQLLTPPSPPEVVAFRQWIVGELIRQVRDGAAPTPFSG